MSRISRHCAFGGDSHRQGKAVRQKGEIQNISKICWYLKCGCAMIKSKGRTRRISMISQRLEKMRGLMAQRGIDADIVPTSDVHE